MPNTEFVDKAEFWAAPKGGRFAYLADLKDVSLDHTTNDQKVETFGGTGFTRGRGATMITFDEAIPRAGKKIDWVKLGMVDHADIMIVMVLDNDEGQPVKRTYHGRVEQPNEKFGLNAAAQAQTRISCGEPQYEQQG
jgi:hypothetical protein